ncbi:DUF1565 domain-containing protein [Pantanalinema rosaneae CENA516]|uniref:DUF1565 domain-containing protein n=1 Tax=Pantanalinema rosaneae TaxID=1620701 RepID=UPI003D6DEBFC
MPQFSVKLRFGMLAAISLGWSSFTPPTQALPVPLRPAMQLAQATPTSYTVLVVNPNSGNDYTADGSNLAPFRSLTKTLQIAQPNTIILLTPGTYSTETGEIFPIALKPGITIQGDVPNRGQMVVIRGGGEFTSPTSGRQNVTIVGANQAMLAGVSVMNSESQGYGLWLESTSPIVVHNTFTANGHSGIAIGGQSQATLRDNYFSRNGVNGISIQDNARPEVQENLLEQTGVAIAINHQASPVITNNRIRQNRIGIVVQASAQPTIRNNLLEDQTEAGLVAIAQAQPNLGTATEPGKNVFRNNAKADINAETASQAIVAYGNDLVKTLGQVTREATSIAATPPPPSQPPSPQLPVPTTSSQPPSSQLPVPTISSQPPTTARAVLPTNPPVSQPSATPNQVSAAAFPIPTELSGTATNSISPSPRPMQVIVRAEPTGTPSQAAQPIATASIATRPQPVVPLPTVQPLAAINSARTATTDIPIDIPVPTPETPESNSITAMPPTMATPSRPPMATPSGLPEATATSLSTIAVSATKAPERTIANLPAVASSRSLPTLPVVTRSTPPTATQASPVLTPRTPVLSQSTPVLTPASTPVLTPPDSLAAQAASIEIPVPPPESGAVAPVVVRPSSPPPGITSSTTTAEVPQILPVPRGDIPIGNIGDMPQVYVARSSGNQTIDSPPVPPQRSFVVVRYRVVVDATDDSQQAQVKSLVPGAFAVSHGGRMVMQVGAFGDRSRADQLMQILVAQGLKASVESME